MQIKKMCLTAAMHTFYSIAAKIKYILTNQVVQYERPGFTFQIQSINFTIFFSKIFQSFGQFTIDNLFWSNYQPFLSNFFDLFLYKSHLNRTSFPGNCLFKRAKSVSQMKKFVLRGKHENRRRGVVTVYELIKVVSGTF